MLEPRSFGRLLRIAFLLVLPLSTILLATPARVSHARGDSQSSGSALSNYSSNTSHSIIRPKAAPDYLVATEYPEGRVLIEWHTGAAIDNLGFNIYREAKGSWDRINPQIIIGAALRTSESNHVKGAYSYSWIDNPGFQEARYWVESIDLTGRSKMFGPVLPRKIERQNGLLPEMHNSLLLSDIGKRNSVTNPESLDGYAPVPGFSEQQLSVQSGLYSADAIKLSVRQEGWYRVTQPELVAAGLDSRIDPRTLQLYADGKEQSFVVRGEEDGRFDPFDVIEFYGVGSDTQCTDTRVYWLTAGTQPGHRVQLIKGKGARPAPASLSYKVERKERTVYFSALQNGDKENFFGAVIARVPVDQALALSHLDQSSPNGATIEVALQGVTPASHKVSVEMNGAMLGELSFFDTAEETHTFAVQPGVLKQGENVVRLTPLAGDSDVSLVDFIRVTYPRAFTAENNALRFSLANKQQVTIDGFSSPVVRVFDITEPDDIRQVISKTQSQGSGYAVTVSSPKPGGRILLALGDDRTEHVAAITSNLRSNLHDTLNAADFIIVSHRNFLERINPLKLLRENKGLKVMVVDVDDIYDEFSYGNKSTQAIKDFLLYSHTKWHSAPGFVLFVGDSSFDPTNYLGAGDFDFVPSRFIDTFWMETVSDDWFADFDGDGLAEIALGRLPVRTADETSRIIDKIVSYGIVPAARNILLVSDLNDGIDFQSGLAGIRNLIPAGFNLAEIDRGAIETGDARRELIESINRGLALLTYFGHGNVDQWRGGLLTSSDATSLANGINRPVVFAITCLNGYFQDPVLDSLAESFIKAERGGAIAVWASSGLCEAWPQSRLNEEMYRALFSPGSNGVALSLGEAALKAKSSISDVEVRLTYILFGDPTLSLQL